MERYKDIIGLTRPKSKHKKMAREKRAAQFAPFDALSGYGEAIYNKGIFTVGQIDLAEDKMDLIKRRLDEILEGPKGQDISITYFVEEKRKSGGYYKKVKDKVLFYDLIKRRLVLEKEGEVELDRIVEIEKKE